MDEYTCCRRDDDAASMMVHCTASLQLVFKFLRPVSEERGIMAAKEI
jgi:hypothetical protein